MAHYLRLNAPTKTKKEATVKRLLIEVFLCCTLTLGANFEETFVEVAANLRDKSWELQGNVSSLQAVKTTGDLVDLAQGLFGESLPSIAISIGGAWAGARSGVKVGGPLRVPTIALGAFVGGFIPSFVSQYGEMLREQANFGLDKPGELILPAAAAAGLDALFPGRLAIGLLKPTSEGILRSAARISWEGFAIEGFTEFVQEGIAIQQRAKYDPTFNLQGEQALYRYLEAMFAGVLVGAGLGAAGGIASSIAFRRKQQE
jgi:hypothetical protein